MGSVKLVINGKVWPYTRLEITSPTSSNIGGLSAVVKCPRRNFTDLLGPVEIWRDGKIIFAGWIQEINPSLRSIDVELSGDSLDYILTSVYTTTEHKYYHKRVDEMVKDLINYYLPDIDTSEVEQHEHEYLEITIANNTQLYDALRGLAILENSYFYLKPHTDKTILVFKRREI